MQKPTAIILTILAILSRLLPHPANFTAVGASSLFAGGKLPRPYNYLLPLVIMVFTDLIIGLHGTMLYVYASFVAIVFMGERFLQNQPSTSRLVVVAMSGSALFFLVTNFGVWMQSAMYPPTAAGLLESYVMGLPFWRNMMIADVLFTITFFKLYQYAENKSLIQLSDRKISYYLTNK